MTYYILYNLIKEFKLRFFILLLFFFFFSFLFYKYIYDIFFLVEQYLIKKKIIQQFFFFSPLDLFYQTILIYIYLLGICIFFIFFLEIKENLQYIKKKIQIPFFFLNLFFSIILSCIHTEFILKYINYELKLLNLESEIAFINMIDLKIFINNYIIIFLIFIIYFNINIINNKKYYNIILLCFFIIIISPPNIILQINLLIITLLIIEIKKIIEIFFKYIQEEWDSNP